MSRVVWSALLACGLLLCCTSCAQTVREAAREAAPAAVEGAVEEAEDPGTRLDIAKVIQDPAIRAASAELSAAVAEGVVAGLASERSEEELEQLTGRLVAVFTAELSESLQGEIGPALARTFAESADGAMKRGLAADLERVLSELARATARGSAQGFGEAMLESDGALSLAVSRVARDVGREAALGVNDAIAQRVRDDERGRADEAQFLPAVGKVADATADGLPLVVWGAVLLLVALVLAILWLMLRLRRRLDQLTAELSRSQRPQRSVSRAARPSVPAPGAVKPVSGHP